MEIIVRNCHYLVVRKAINAGWWEIHFLGAQG